MTQKILNRIQAVTEGSIIPGAVLPPPGHALGEVPPDAPAAPSNGVPVAAGVGDA